MMLARCVFTVLSEMCSSPPISPLPSPRATASSTASSRSVSGLAGDTGGSGRELAKALMSRSVTVGSISASPRAAARTASARSSRPRVFQEESARTRAERGVYVLVEVECRDDDDRDRIDDIGAGEPAGRLEAVHDRHPDVDQTHIGTQSACKCDGFCAVTGFADDLDTRLRVEDHAQARADQVLVVGDEHAHVHAVHLARGSAAFTTHPPFGPRPASQVPPRRAARSCMPRMP